MASNSCTLLQSLSGDPEFEKQIGCMAGILQIFDRHQVLTGRRLYGNRRIAEAGNSSKSGYGSPTTSYHSRSSGEPLAESSPDEQMQQQPLPQQQQVSDGESRRHIQRASALQQRQASNMAPNYTTPGRSDAGVAAAGIAEQKLLIRDVVGASPAAQQQLQQQQLQGQHGSRNRSSGGGAMAARTVDISPSNTYYYGKRSEQKKQQQLQYDNIMRGSSSTVYVHHPNYHQQPAPQRLDSSRSLHEARANGNDHYMDGDDDDDDHELLLGKVFPRRSVDTQPISSTTTPRPKFGAYCPALQQQPTALPPPDNAAPPPDPPSSSSTPYHHRQPQHHGLSNNHNKPKLPTESPVRSSTDLTETLKLLAKLREIDDSCPKTGTISSSSSSGGHRFNIQSQDQRTPAAPAPVTFPREQPLGGPASAALSRRNAPNYNFPEPPTRGASSTVDHLLLGLQGIPQYASKKKEVSRLSHDSGNCRGAAADRADMAAAETRSQLYYSSCCNSNAAGTTSRSVSCSNSDCDADSFGPPEKRTAASSTFSSNVVARLMGLEQQPYRTKIKPTPIEPDHPGPTSKNPTGTSAALVDLQAAPPPPAVSRFSRSRLTTLPEATAAATSRTASFNSGANLPTASAFFVPSRPSRSADDATARQMHKKKVEDFDEEFEEEEEDLDYARHHLRSRSGNGAAAAGQIRAPAAAAKAGGGAEQDSNSKPQQQRGTSTSSPTWIHVDSSATTNGINVVAPFYQPTNHRFMEDRTPSVLSSAVKLCAQIEEMQRRGSWQRTADDSSSMAKPKPPQSAKQDLEALRHLLGSIDRLKRQSASVCGGGGSNVTMNGIRPGELLQKMEAEAEPIITSRVDGGASESNPLFQANKPPAVDVAVADPPIIRHGSGSNNYSLIIREDIGRLHGDHFLSSSPSRRIKHTTGHGHGGVSAAETGSSRHHSSAADLLLYGSRPQQPPARTSRDQTLNLRHSAASNYSKVGSSSPPIARSNHGSSGGGHGRSSANPATTSKAAPSAGARSSRSGIDYFSASSHEQQQPQASQVHGQQQLNGTVQRRHVDDIDVLLLSQTQINDDGRRRSCEASTTRFKERPLQQQSSRTPNYYATNRATKHIGNHKRAQNKLGGATKYNGTAAAAMVKDHDASINAAANSKEEFIKMEAREMTMAAAPARTEAARQEVDNGGIDEHGVNSNRSSSRMTILSDSFQKASAVANKLLPEEAGGVKRKLDFQFAACADTEWRDPPHRSAVDKTPTADHLENSCSSSVHETSKDGSSDSSAYHRSTSSASNIITSSSEGEDPANSPNSLLSLDGPLSPPTPSKSDENGSPTPSASEHHHDLSRHQQSVHHSRDSPSAEALRLLAPKDNDDTESQGDIKSTGSSCDQPSPISVLDGPFCREESSTGISSPPEEEYMDAFSELESTVEDHVAAASNDEGDDDDVRGRGRSEAEFEGECCVGRQQHLEDFEYVKRLLERAAEGGGASAAPPGAAAAAGCFKLAPLDPGLFPLLEEEEEDHDKEKETDKYGDNNQYCKRDDDGGMWRRKLLFDAVDASLRRRIRRWRCLEQQPWVLINKKDHVLLGDRASGCRRLLGCSAALSRYVGFWWSNEEEEEVVEVWVSKEGGSGVLLQEVWEEISMRRSHRSRSAAETTAKKKKKGNGNGEKEDDEEEEEEEEEGDEAAAAAAVDRLLEEDHHRRNSTMAGGDDDDDWCDALEGVAMDSGKGEVAMDMERMLFKDLIDHLLRDLPGTRFSSAIATL